MEKINENSGKIIKANPIGAFIVYISFILIIPAIAFLSKRNSLISMRSKVEESVSDIDVQLKRRRDTLTKLIDSVKGSMNFEKSTFEKIVSLRQGNVSDMSVAEKSKLNSQMDTLSKSINVTLENYPNLKSTEAVINFQSSVQDIEENLAASRRIYNQNVNSFNVTIQSWPASVVASAMKLSTKEFFEATETEREDVKVDF